MISQLVVAIILDNYVVIAILSSLLCRFCMSAVLHLATSPFRLFGFHNQLLLLYMGAPFFGGGLNLQKRKGIWKQWKWKREMEN